MNNRSIPSLSRVLVALLSLALSGCLTGTARFDDVAGGAGSTNTTPLPSISCPTGYIPVPGNAALGTTSFCVMRYEAKAWEDTNADGIVDAGEVDADGCGDPGCTTANWAAIPTYKPVSQADGLPWRQINQIQAFNACSALGPNFALISNAEWMTIARDIEAQAGNWSGGAVGSGAIFQGNNGFNTSSSYDGSDPEGGTGRNTKAMHVLSNGEQIWDIAGNLWEWVDWSVTPANKAFYSGDGSPQYGFHEFTFLDTLIGTGDEMFPNSWQSAHPAYGSSQGIGQYYAGDNSSGGAAYRGASFSDGGGTGVFALALDDTAWTTYNVLGFRCAYHP